MRRRNAEAPPLSTAPLDNELVDGTDAGALTVGGQKMDVVAVGSCLC